MTTILLKAFGESLANVTYYSLKHLHRNSFDFLLNLMFQLLNCVGCWRFEDLRFQIPSENEITCWKIRWPDWPCDVPISGDNVVRKQIPHSCHGISCSGAYSSILLEKYFFGYWMMRSKLRTYEVPQNLNVMWSSHSHSFFSLIFKEIPNNSKLRYHTPQSDFGTVKWSLMKFCGVCGRPIMEILFVNKPG